MAGKRKIKSRNELPIEQLVDLHIHQKLPCTIIAEKLGVSIQAIRNRLKDEGIEIQKYWSHTKIPEGKSFWKWTVLRKTNERDITGAILYECRCQCGIERLVPSCSLVKGLSKSCGKCYTTEIRSSWTRKRPYEHLFNRVKFMANKRNLTFDFTYESFLTLTEIKNCHYCSASIDWLEYYSNKGKNKSLAYHLDRKDNSIGYLMDNCVVACTRCNRCRMDKFTYEEWVKIGEVIKTFNKGETL